MFSCTKSPLAGQQFKLLTTVSFKLCKINTVIIQINWCR